MLMDNIDRAKKLVGKGKKKVLLKGGIQNGKTNS